jgi:hypothetical protein
MIGLPVIGTLALYVLIAWLCIKWVRNYVSPGGKRIAVTTILALLFILVPIADDFVGQWQFGRLCEKEAGTKIYRTISGVVGFRSNEFFIEWLTKSGYRYVEHEKFPGNVLRKSLDVNGKVVEETISEPESKYAFRYSKTSMPNHMWKGQYAVLDLDNKEVVATRTNLTYSGGWLQRMLGQVGGGTGYWCPNDSFRMSDLLESSLIPQKTKQEGK